MWTSLIRVTTQTGQSLYGESSSTKWEQTSIFFRSLTSNLMLLVDNSSNRKGCRITPTSFQAPFKSNLMVIFSNSTTLHLDSSPTIFPSMPVLLSSNLPLEHFHPKHKILELKGGVIHTTRLSGLCITILILKIHLFLFLKLLLWWEERQEHPHTSWLTSWKLIKRNSSMTQ